MTRISDMTPLAALPVIGAYVPVERTGSTTNYRYDLSSLAGQDALFVNAASFSVPAETDMVATTGYSVLGVGSAIYIYDASVNSAYVIAHPRSSFISLNGRGFRLSLAQDITPQMFGAVGNGVTDDSAAFVAAIAYLNAAAVNSISNYKASAGLFIPAGHYYLGTTTLDITHTLIIEGEGGQGIGAGGGAATKLRWAAGATGFRFQTVNTSSSGTVDGSPHFSGGFSTLRQLYLCGPSAATNALSTLGLTEGEYHGIHAKAPVFLDTVFVEGFQGDGLYAHTTTGAGDATEGTTNASRAYNCWFRACRNGISILGADANVWTFVGCQATFNRACGVDDQSFLGNTHIGWHTAGNGVYLDNDGTASFPAYVVSYSSKRYVVIQGQETGASTNAPSGTTANNTWWYYLSSGGVATGYPAWVSGMHLRCAAPYRTNNANASNVFVNPYEEGDQGLSQFVSPTVVIAGLHGAGPPKGTGAFVHNISGAFSSKQIGALSETTSYGLTIRDADTYGSYLDLYDGTTEITLVPSGGDFGMGVLGSSNPATWYFSLLGESTANNVGKRRLNFPNGFGNGSLKEQVGTAAPVAGAYVVGDRVRNSVPSVGQPKAWVCTVAGSPGTWVSEGNL